MKTKLPGRIQLAYALGQLGWSLLSGIVATYLIFYYIPTNISGIPVSIPQVQFFGFLTIIGLIMMLGRLFDAITDPWIATLSDQSTHKKGRRISFMQKSALPFALFTVLVFFHPFAASNWWNVVVLTINLLLFYLFLTMYVTPFFALLSELGHTPKERLNLSTYISITWFIGFAIASQAPSLWGVFEGMGYDKVTAMRLAFSILSLIGLIFLYIPVLFIDEKKYTHAVPSTIGMIDSIKATFKNKFFSIFVFSDLVYWVAITIFQSTLIYYVTILLSLPEDTTGTLLVLLGLGSFVFYVPVNLLSTRFGKKALMVVAFILFIMTYSYGAFLGTLPLVEMTQAYVLVGLGMFPMAVFGILPNAMVADIAQYDAIKTGVRREAMFFGTRTFMSKMGQMISMLVISALLLIERNGSNEFGIRLTAVAAGIFCFLGLVLLLFYREKDIQAVITAQENQNV
ncbi:MAG: MFS transporter [Erysipelothrix sp.]|jgi:GPH family glycoside/pentoside/hexuronide:cation symporter|nr:MFS transporter [Erysipelothrix sp.]